MKINEDNILNDMGKIYLLTNNPSYSKNKKYFDDLDLINYLYLTTYGKFFNLHSGYNPYHDRLKFREYDKDYAEAEDLIRKYKEYYLESAKNYINILQDNNFFHVPYRCKKIYNDKELKELLLDFFNDESADKYKIIKSMFDEERISDVPLNNLDCGGFCNIFSSNIKPYVVVGNYNGKNKLLQAMHLAHEFGHTIEAHYILNRCNEFYKNKNLALSEVSSMFYELEFLKYLQKNRINAKDTPNLINYYYLFVDNFLKDLFCSDSNELTFEGEKYISSSKDFYLEDNRNLVRPFKKVNEENDLDYWLEVDFYDPLIYGFGGYLALHLSELKKQDSKEFNKAWNYYLSTRTLMNYEEIFNLFGLNVDEFVSGKLIEPTIKQDLENYRKQLIRKNDYKR